MKLCLRTVLLSLEQVREKKKKKTPMKLRDMHFVSQSKQSIAFLSKRDVKFSTFPLFLLRFLWSSSPKAIKLLIDFCISARFLAPRSPSLAIDPHKAADSKVRGPIRSGLRK